MPTSETYLIKIQLQIQNDKALRALTSELDRAAKQAPKTAKAMKATAVNTKQFGRVAQNAGYQIQDFVVQVQGGVDPMRAMSQQLPQMLIGFGAWGAAIGVVAALLPTLIQLMKNTDDGLKDTEKEADAAAEAVERLAKTFDDMSKAASDIGSISSTLNMQGYIEELGKANAAQRELLESTLEFQKAIAEMSIQQSLENFTLPISVGLESGQGALDAYNDRLKEFGKTVGITYGEMIVLEGAFREATEASTRNSQNLGALIVRLQEVFVAGGARNQQLKTTIELLTQAQQAVSNLESAEQSLNQTTTAGTADGEVAGTLSLIEVTAKRVPSALAVLQVANADWEAMEQERLQAQYDLEIAYGNTAKSAEESAGIQAEAFAVFDQSFQTMLNGVLMGTQTLEEGFKSMVKVIIAELLKLAAYQFFANAFGINIGGVAPTPSAQGNAFNNGNVIPFANGGIVNGPTVFPMAKGVGLMGEAGPEAVMPLTRLPNGNLGVESAGMNVTINNLAPGVDVRTSQGDDGLTIDVVMATIANAVQRGGNNVADAMEQSYSLNRGRAVY